MFLIQPINLDLNSLRESIPLDSSTSNDRILLIINQIYQTYVFDEGMRRNDDYVYVYAHVLESCYYKYRKILDWLKENEVIEIYEGFSKGVYPKCYRLHSTYRHQKSKLVHVTDPRVIKYLRNNQLDLSETTINRYPALWKFFREGKLKFDRTNIESILQDQLDQDILNIGEDNAYRRYSEKVFSIGWIESNRYWFKQDKFGKRLHTNITNLKSELRSNLLYDDSSKLVEVDIRNSQPYFSIPVLEKVFEDNQEEIREYMMEEYGIGIDIMKNDQDNSINVSYTLQETQSNPLFMGYSEYKNLILSGDLYDVFKFKGQEQYGENYLQDYVNRLLIVRNYQVINNGGKKISYGGKTPRKQPISNSSWVAPDLRGYQDRTIIKTMIFGVFYGKHEISSSHGDYKSLFKSLFPDVWYALGIIKGGEGKSGREFAKKLQRMESASILDVICKRLTKAKRNLPLYTIHDCVMTTEENVDYVTEVLQEELTRITGYPPEINIH
ncbi:MAG: hypothetical protein HUJ25_13395 [Crocinitomicaceae bacterium]|nr:hypothetical protein [Crocinitomicaceae bacterium]